MSALFGLLFLASLIALLIGLIKPGLFSSFLKGKKRIALVLGSTASVFLILSSIPALQQAAQNKQSSSANYTTQRHYVFDVLSLVGKNIDEVRIILGEPNDKNIEPSEDQLKRKIDKWQNTYKNDGRELIVTFNPINRKVVDLFVSKKKGETKEKLLKTYNLNEKDSRYKAEFVKDPMNPSDFTGVKVTTE